MKIKITLRFFIGLLPVILFLFLTKNMQAQNPNYPLVTLHDINYIANQDTLPYFPQSPLAGDTVRVRGVVTVRTLVGSDEPGVGDRRAIIWAGYAWACYIQDKDNPEWGGVQVYQGDSTVSLTGFDLADTAKVYEFTGVVTPYYQATELALITKPNPIPIEEIEALPKRPEPLQLTLDSLFSNETTGNYLMRKYQGVYVEFKADDNHNLVTSDRVTGTGSTSGNFKINESLTGGKYVMVYAQSAYFKTNSFTLRPEYVSPVNGTYLSYIRGVLTMRSNTTVGVDYWIVPLYPDDLGSSLVIPPSISNVVRNIGVVGPNQDVTVSCLAKGVQTTLQSVKLFYRVNQGSLDSLDMAATVGDSIYSATIPGVLDSALVDYYIQAIDLNGTSINNPANINTSRYFYIVLNRQLRIQDIRYTPFETAYSGFNNYRVSDIQGVVIADTSDIPGSINRGGSNPFRVYIQNGSGPWSGILLGTISNADAVKNLHRGDKITVSGTVMLGSLGTKIDSITAIQVLSPGNALPEPQYLATSEVGVYPLGTQSAEKWNGTLVKYEHIVIDSLNADGNNNYGESYVNDGALPHTRLIWSDGNTHYHNGWNSSYIGNPLYTYVAKGDSFQTVIGVLGYTHYYYKLCPRKDDDIIGYKAVGVEKEVNSIPDNFKVSQNYPNPFNPSTTISYSIPTAEMVTIKVYNILGQQVASIVNEFKNAGNYKVNFNASSLSSGVYFYNVKAGSMSVVKKMILMK